jgi:hypothetical protein
MKILYQVSQIHEVAGFKAKGLLGFPCLFLCRRNMNIQIWYNLQWVKFLQKSSGLSEKKHMEANHILQNIKFIVE